MRIKRIIGALLLLALLTSCGGNAEKDPIEPNLPADTSQVTEAERAETEKTEAEKTKAEEAGTEKSEAEKAETEKSEAENEEPENSREMFDFVMDKWKTSDTEVLYSYLSDEMLSLCDRDTIVYMFESITETFGEIVSNSEPQMIAFNGIDVYSSTVRLENADVDISLSLKDSKIYGFSRDIRFTGEFDVTHGSIREHYFLLNGLNAVYTCSESSESAPAVLLISGSGPCDYNETVGLLSPMEDLALGLAGHGISSLRLEKRTLRFFNDFNATDGIEEEYFNDCRAALAYLKELDNTDGVYLLRSV